MNPAVDQLLTQRLSDVSIGDHEIFHHRRGSTEMFMCVECEWECSYRKDFDGITVSAADRRKMEGYAYGDALATPCEGDRDIDIDVDVTATGGVKNIDVSLDPEPVMRTIDATLTISDGGGT